MVIRRCLILLLSCAAALLAAAPQRIISTAPSITEMLYTLGLGDRVVGVTTYCHYPAEARSKPKIGTYIEPNLELIASLKPDLVVIQKNPIRLEDKLRALKLNVLEVTHDTIEEVYGSIQKIADAAGVSDRARALNDKLREQLAQIRNAVAGQPTVKMMFVVGRAPSRLEDLIAVGKASYLNEIMAVAGGENIFKAAVAAYPKISMEEVLARSPGVIVDMGDMSQTEGVTEAHKREVVALWKRYASLRARVFAVASDVFTVPGPRMVDAAREFAKMLHPEARL